MLRSGVGFLFLFFFCASAFLHELHAQDTYPVRPEAMIAKGQYEEAIKTLEKNIDKLRSDTAYSEEMSWLANLYLLKNDWSKMIELYRGYTFSPGEDTSLLNAARFYNSLPKQELSFNPDAAVTSFKPSKSGTPMITVKVNGKKYRFWVDTGAGLSVVSSDVAKKCGIKLNKQTGAGARAATGKMVQVDYGLIDELVASNVTVKNHPVLVISKEALTFKLFGIRIIKIDGIVGWNFLQEMNVKIDFVNKQLEFSQLATKKQNQEQNFFWMEQPYVKCKLNGDKDGLVFIDTGANTSGIYQSIYSKVDTTGSTYKTIGIGSAGGSVKIRSLILPQLNVKVMNEEVRMKKVTTEPTTHAEGKFIPDGVLGIRELKPYVLTFNLKEGYLLLEKTAKK